MPSCSSRVLRLRLYPGLPYIERVATVSDVIPLGDSVELSTGEVINQLPVSPSQVRSTLHIVIQILRSQTTNMPLQVVLIPCIAIHRMDSVWKDPDMFRPERWLADLPPSDMLCSGWSNTLAFSDGPRNCIGYRLGASHLLCLSGPVSHFSLD